MTFQEIKIEYKDYIQDIEVRKVFLLILYLSKSNKNFWNEIFVKFNSVGSNQKNMIDQQ